MADEADSKSVAGNRVWVQVPLPAVKCLLKEVDSWKRIGFFLLQLNMLKGITLFRTINLMVEDIRTIRFLLAVF